MVDTRRSKQNYNFTSKDIVLTKMPGPCGRSSCNAKKPSKVSKKSCVPYKSSSTGNKVILSHGFEDLLMTFFYSDVQQQNRNHRAVKQSRDELLGNMNILAVNAALAMIAALVIRLVRKATTIAAIDAEGVENVFEMTFKYAGHMDFLIF